MKVVCVRVCDDGEKVVISRFVFVDLDNAEADKEAASECIYTY